MAIKDAIRNIWNMFLLVLAVLLLGILLITSFFGFIEVMKSFDAGNEGITLFISFIVLSLTLSILSYTASTKEKKEENYIKIARNFTVSAILMFIVYVSMKGFKISFSQTPNQILPTITAFVIIICLFYSIVGFIFTLIWLLLEQMGLIDKFLKDIKDTKGWFDNLKYKKIIVILIFIFYVIIIIFFSIKEYFLK
jgi:hypothetical protein